MTVNINVYDLYRSLKYEPSFTALSMSEKLHMLERISNTIQRYEEAGQGEKIALITPEFILDHIGKRGFNRSRRVLQMCDSLEIKLREFKLSKDDADLQFKDDWKKKIFDL